MPRRTHRLLTRVLAPVLTVLALAATMAPAHAFEVDDFAPYQPQVSCDPHAKPGVIATRNLMLDKFGGGDLGIVRSCRIGGLSEHKEGRAWDWALNANRPADRRKAKRAIKWLTRTVHGEDAANARALGIQYIIWNKRMWRAYDPTAGWQRYTGSSAHRDHMHLSFTWNGATKTTGYWTGTLQPFDFGPCPKWVGEMARPWKAPQLEPCPTALQRPVADENGIYLAQEGETLNRIARWFHLTPEQVMVWNNWTVPELVLITPGDPIRVTEDAVWPDWWTTPWDDPTLTG
jgi:hypothetical protein